MEDRTECQESGAVSYKRDVANVLALEIDPAAATNKEELDEYQVSSMTPSPSPTLLGPDNLMRPSVAGRKLEAGSGSDCEVGGLSMS